MHKVLIATARRLYVPAENVGGRVVCAAVKEALDCDSNDEQPSILMHSLRQMPMRNLRGLMVGLRSKIRECLCVAMCGQAVGVQVVIMWQCHMRNQLPH